MISHPLRVTLFRATGALGSLGTQRVFNTDVTIGQTVIALIGPITCGIPRYRVG